MAGQGKFYQWEIDSQLSAMKDPVADLVLWGKDSSACRMGYWSIGNLYLPMYGEDILHEISEVPRATSTFVPPHPQYFLAHTLKDVYLFTFSPEALFTDMH